jgi:hypothetical protein
MPDLQLKRGTPAQVDAYQGPAGEIVVDSQNWNMRLQDGVTAGGVLLGSNENLIARPEILSPIQGSVIGDQSPILVSTAYSGEGVHSASQWQISGEVGFVNLIHDSGRNTVSLLSYNLLDAGVTLTRGVTLYVRVRHESGTAGWSEWSEALSFSVQAMEPGTVLDDGGIIFAQDGNDWLVVAPASLRALRTWNDGSTSWVDTPLPNYTSNPEQDVNDGTYNTDVLVNVTQEQKAATYCRSIGYDLPNAAELRLIYNNRAQIDAADTSGGGATLSAIQSGTAPGSTTAYVWSSTEYNSFVAWALYFGNGNWYASIKHNSVWVVPFRRIPV